jgi:hypothetical protein
MPFKKWVLQNINYLKVYKAKSIKEKKEIKRGANRESAINSKESQNKDSFSLFTCLPAGRLLYPLSKKTSRCREVNLFWTDGYQTVIKKDYGYRFFK